MKFSDVLFMISGLVLSACPLQSSACACQSTLTSLFSIEINRNDIGEWNSKIIRDKGCVESVKKELQDDSYKIRVVFTDKIYGSLYRGANTTGPLRNPGPGYEFFAGAGYYKFHTTNTTWDDAKSTCAREGGYLFILNSDAEANIAKQLFSRHPKVNNTAFVGFKEGETNGQYFTIFGEPLETTGYAKWEKGHPDSFVGYESCGVVYRDGTLNEIWCGQRIPFICEYELS